MPDQHIQTLKKAKEGDPNAIQTACRLLKVGFYRQLVWRNGSPDAICEKGFLCTDLLENYIKRTVDADGTIKIEQTVKTQDEWKQYFITVSANDQNCFQGETFNKLTNQME